MKNYCHLCGAKYIEGKSQPWECSGCGNLSYENSKPCAEAVIFNEQRQVLIAKRAIDPQKGTYDLPGGFVMLGETIEEAVEREIEEELGLKKESYSSPKFCMSWVAEYPYSNETVTTVTSDFVILTKTDQIQAMDDVESARFYNLDEINSLKFSYKKYPQIIQKAYKQLFG